MHCFAFDIETVPDTEFGRRLYDLEGLGDEEVAAIMFGRRRQQTGHEFLPLLQHKVVAISIAFRSTNDFKIWSLGGEAAGEAELIQRFYDGLDRYTPDLVSWNGSGFDLPVLHYRALRHGIAARRYWETGDEDQSFRWNSYLGRFHWRHIDLMDVLSGYQHQNRASLNDVAVLLGFPGKLGVSGEDVFGFFSQGDIASVRNYCETDVLSTYLIYLRFEMMRGRLDAKAFDRECELVRNTLAQAKKSHFDDFLTAWQGD